MTPYLASSASMVETSAGSSGVVPGAKRATRRPSATEPIPAADVLLDTFHFSGGNTSFEAFAVGTPVVTLPSGFLRGRFTAGLYRKMGVADLIAETAESYVDLALRAPQAASGDVGS